MSSRLPSVDWTWWGKITAAFLLLVVTGAGLVFVFSPIFDLGWIGKPPSDKVSFYVTGVGVPLLTFAGFLSVLLGFLAQQEQNELQERQLENQQEQLSAQKKQLRRQQKNFKKDRFESTFFQLLRTHNQIVNDISCGGSRFSESGRNCFKMFFEAFEHSFEKNGEEDADLVDLDEVSEAYKEWYKNEKSVLNHYFNNLTKIISFVDESDAKNKQFYIDLVIAQMSVPELKLFFYHSGSMTDQKRYVGKVDPLLGQYNFFGQLTPSSLLHEEHDGFHPDALGVQH